jgi:mitotic-spindle organizing protein 1
MNAQQNNAREALESKCELIKHHLLTNTTTIAAYELNNVLNAGLDRESLSLLIQLVEMGVNPEALAACVKELRSEAQAIQQKQQSDIHKR